MSIATVVEFHACITDTALMATIKNGNVYCLKHNFVNRAGIENTVQRIKASGNRINLSRWVRV